MFNRLSNKPNDGNLGNSLITSNNYDKHISGYPPEVDDWSYSCFDLYGLSFIIWNGWSRLISVHNANSFSLAVGWIVRLEI